MKHKFYLLLLFFSLCGLLFLSTPTYAAMQTYRFQGTTSIENSIKLSKANWDSAQRVILISGDQFSNALCAVPLSKKYDAPILFTEKGKLSESTTNELLRLKPEQVFLIGETEAIGQELTDALSNLGIEYTQISGSDPFDTSLRIAEKLDAKGRVAVVSNSNYQDAISISTIAADAEMPILLTNPDSVPQSTISYIQDNGINTCYAIGDQNSISDSVLSVLPNATRIAGANHYETTLAVLKDFESVLSYNRVYVSSEDNFTDSLIAASIAAKNFSPLLLINADSAPKAKDFLAGNATPVSEMVIIGSQQSLPVPVIKGLTGKGSYSIVLDPGHGGADPGAIGVNGAQEKNVNLQIALKVGKILQDNGVDVVYTRDTDALPWEYTELNDLQNRSDISNTVNPTFFVSIHSNSCPVPSVGGTCTYYQSGNDKSYSLAQSIQQQLINAVGTKDNGTPTANYYVLRNTNNPAVLVEVAYLSNYYEASLLDSESFQQKAAEGIAKGILQALP